MIDNKRTFRDRIEEKQWRKDHHRGGYDVRKVQANINRSRQQSKKEEDIER